jgi:Oxygenase domain of the 2OGFeDO superfamily
MIDIRLRTKVADAAVKELAGRVLGHRDYDLLLTGPTWVRMPDNRPLCVYLPGALTAACTDDVYQILHGLKGFTTDNRGAASGTRRIRAGSGTTPTTRTRSVPVASSVVGAVDPIGQSRYCRLTAWTGRNLPQWQALQPFLQQIAEHFRQYVPDRYAAQQARAAASHPAWIVPGTPFSTITVNNTYPTGVHTDKGDLDEGFSSIAVLRRGTYTGGQLIFPQYRVAADLHDGDLILMDAHQWHGNVPVTCACGSRPNGPCKTCGAERISVVSYYRTKITTCGSPAEEAARATALRERHQHPTTAGAPDGQ